MLQLDTYQHHSSLIRPTSHNYTSSDTDMSTISIPADIAHGANQSPVQPKQHTFPGTFIGGRQRSFSSSWYEKYSWIEYSTERDAVYCYPCRLFLIGDKKEDAFTKSGYRDWKHATGKSGVLHKHDRSVSHKQAVLTWKDYIKNTELGTTIGIRIDLARSKRIEENRHYNYECGN